MITDHIITKYFLCTSCSLQPLWIINSVTFDNLRKADRDEKYFLIIFFALRNLIDKKTSQSDQSANQVWFVTASLKKRVMVAQ